MCLAVALHSAFINQLAKPTAECAAAGRVLELSLELRYADAGRMLAERVENPLVIVPESPIWHCLIARFGRNFVAE